MGGEQAASVLATVKRDQMARESRSMSADEEAAIRTPCRFLACRRFRDHRGPAPFSRDCCPFLCISHSALPTCGLLQCRRKSTSPSGVGRERIGELSATSVQLDRERNLRVPPALTEVAPDAYADRFFCASWFLPAGSLVNFAHAIAGVPQRLVRNMRVALRSPCLRVT